MGFHQTTLNLAELESDDLLESLVAHGEVGHDHQASQECGLEDLVQLGLEGLHHSFRVGHGLRIGRELHQRFSGGVTGEQNDGVAEVDFAAFAIFHSALVEDLEEELKDIGVGLFDFVEENHGIGPAADSFSQDATLTVADISRRRTLQGGDSVRFLKLGHVDGDHVAFAAVEGVGEGDGGFCLAHTAGPDEEKDADRLDRIVKVGARGEDSLGNGGERLILADDALLEMLVECEDSLNFIAYHLAEGNAGPGGYDFTDDLRIDGDAHHALFSLQRVEFRFQLGEVGEDGGFIRIGIFLLSRLKGFLQGANLCGESFFLFPLRGEEVAFFRGSGDLGFDFSQLFRVIAADFCFAFEDALLHFESVDLAENVFEARRR